MREILFRGKAIDDNWYYGVPLVFTEDYVCMTAPHTYNKSVIPGTVGQYTGLTDKNGKKIFEGDILHPFDDEIIVVEWIDHYSTLGLTVYVSRKEKKRGKETIKEYSGWAYLNDYDLAKLEIIGNIHDNPELLKGVKDDV